MEPTDWLRTQKTWKKWRNIFLGGIFFDNFLSKFLLLPICPNSEKIGGNRRGIYERNYRKKYPQKLFLGQFFKIFLVLRWIVLSAFWKTRAWWIELSSLQTTISFLCISFFFSISTKTRTTHTWLILDHTTLCIFVLRYKYHLDLREENSCKQCNFSDHFSVVWKETDKNFQNEFYL